MTWMFSSVKIDKGQHNTWQQPTIRLSNLTRMVEGFGHKVYVDGFFSSPDLLDDLAQKSFPVVGQWCYIERACPRTSKPKTLRLKHGDIRIRTRVDLTAVVWRDKRDVCLLTNIHNPPKECNYCNELENAIKPAVVADHNCLMGHVDNADRMANTYITSRQTWKWTKKKSFSTFWTWPLSTVTSFYLHVVGRKSHHMFLTHPHQRDAGMGWTWATTIHACRKTSPSLLLTSEDWTHVTMNSGMATIPQNGGRVRGMTGTVMFICVKCDVALCRFFRNLSSPLCSKDISAFLMYTVQCLFLSPQNAFCFTDLSCLALEIFRFFKSMRKI